MASRSWNRVELIGNLTRDPELRYTPNGAAVCTFSIATNRTYISDGEKKEEVDFHRLVSWNKLAELCNQLLKKGNRVFISGRLQNRSWETADGQTRNVTEIVVEDMIVLSPRLEVSAPAEVGDINLAEPKAEPEPVTESESKPEAEPEPSKEVATTGEDTVVVADKKKEKASKSSETPNEDVEDLPF